MHVSLGFISDGCTVGKLGQETGALLGGLKLRLQEKEKAETKKNQMVKVMQIV